MRDLVGELLVRWSRGEAVGLATVVSTSSSAPRPPGAAMLVGSAGEVAGSVSGGCVEGAVYEAATEVLATGESRLESYGYSDATAFAVGLTCGGSIEVFVRRIDHDSFPELAEVAEDIELGRPVAVATLLTGRLAGRSLAIRPGAALSAEHAIPYAVIDQARELLASGRNGVVATERIRVFVESFRPAPRMLIFGANDFAAAMAETGSFLGYRVTVCDARATFATEARFPMADEVVVDWPHRYLAAQADRLDARTVVCVLTHDEKFDIPLLTVALRLPQLAYIGAMGSRRTVADRLARLSADGLASAELARLVAPIGLDLGARTPAETAISIAAEILAAAANTSATPLTQGTGRIHRDSREPVTP